MHTASEAEVVKNAFRDVLQEYGMTPGDHATHHAYISEMIRRRQARAELFQWAKKTFIGILVTGAFLLVVRFFIDIAEWLLFVIKDIS